jgi:hypothetical protein
MMGNRRPDGFVSPTGSGMSWKTAHQDSVKPRLTVELGGQIEAREQCTHASKAEKA